MNIANQSIISDDERLVIVKQELTILASKIGGTVDTLWKIRGLSLTLWTAAFTVGIGNFSFQKQPILMLLVLTAFLPLLFLFVDAKNNQWYRRLSGREFQIQQFLNDPGYVLPASGQRATYKSGVEGMSLFPVYDLTGAATFDNDAQFAWQTTLLRSMVDPIPTVVYWSQVFFSASACTIYGGSSFRWICLPVTFSSFAVLRILASLKRKQISKIGNPIAQTLSGQSSM